MRIIEEQIQGQQTFDGAGVDLTRVLSQQTVYDFDPILMLDAFDSTDPESYKAGFPEHPHRGIEAISYVISGEMHHKDSLGNEDTLHDGDLSVAMRVGISLARRAVGRPARMPDPDRPGKL